MQQIVTENWIKPPKIITYTNAIIESQDDSELICSFFFPRKYSRNDFYLGDKKVLDAGQMFMGRRHFYPDRFYSLLEFYDEHDNLSAYYLDVVLPALLFPLEVIILDLKIDFFIKPDKKEYYTLDEDEMDAAIIKNYFSSEEVKACQDSTDFIKSHIDHGKYDQIFTEYPKSFYNSWDRYKRYL